MIQFWRKVVENDRLSALGSNTMVFECFCESSQHGFIFNFWKLVEKEFGGKVYLQILICKNWGKNPIFEFDSEFFFSKNVLAGKSYRNLESQRIETFFEKQFL